MTRPEVLVPAKCLAQNPQREGDGNEEQAKTNWATPAEPRAPGAPVLEAVAVVLEFLFVVLETLL